MRFATAFALLLFAAPALAQMPGSCQLGSAQADLDISDVQARLFTTGSLFFGNTTTAGNGYIVPKATATLPTPLSPIFAAGIWVGGMMDGELRVAGSTYIDFEFWPGPLEPGATLPDPDDCSPYDRFWTVDVFDVQRYDETGTASADLAEWPVALGAPVVDGDGVAGNYNLEGGDRPAVYGHQTAFWVMNDLGNEHRRTLTQPMGLEVRVTAFASVEADLAQQTLYRYELVNRNALPLEDARFSLFVDADLGDASDDFVGTDTTRGMAFVYNRSEVDANYGIPPAAGFDLLNGAGNSIWFLGENSPAGDPNNGEEMYPFMRGLWGDGTPMRAYGDGYMQAQGDTTAFLFPGDPVTQAYWSEENIDGEGTRAGSGDRRLLLSSPSFTLGPGEARAFDLAILFGQGDDRLDSVTALRAASDAVQARYDAGELFAPSVLQPPPPGTLATPDLLAPEKGAFFFERGPWPVETVPLSWTAVPGAEGYRVELATNPEFTERTRAFYPLEPALAFDGGPDENELLEFYWRVKAITNDLEASRYSEPRSFTFYRYVSDDFGGGAGIVETAYPGTDVCPDVDDSGCEGYGGNTVWLDPNISGDYVLTTPGNELGAGGLNHYSYIFEGEDYELRFTEACATFGTCLGLYDPFGSSQIVSVPFELWNVGLGLGKGDTPDDDLRMIPVLITGGEPPLDWADTFNDAQSVIVASDVLELPVTDPVY